MRWIGARARRGQGIGKARLIGGPWILVECRQALLDDVGQDADGDSAYESRKKQHREVA